MIFISPVSALSSALSSSDSTCCNLFFKLNDLHFSSLCSLLSSLKLRFNLLQPLLNLLILFVSIFSLIPSCLKFLLKLAHPLFILDGSVFQDLPHSVRVISSSSSLVKFVGCLEKFVLTLLKIFLKTLNSSVESINLQLS